MMNGNARRRPSPSARALGAIAVLLGACGRTVPKGTSTSQTSALPASAPTATVAQAPAKRNQFLIALGSPTTRETVERLPKWEFYTPHITKGSRFEVKDLDKIAAHVSFVAASGARTAARGDEPTMQRHPQMGHWFVLIPVNPLEPSSRYTLVIEEDDEVEVINGAPYHAERNGKASYRLPFVTGTNIEANVPAVAGEAQAKAASVRGVAPTE